MTYICQFLSVSDAYRLSRVNKELYEFCKSRDILRRLVDRNALYSISCKANSVPKLVSWRYLYGRIEFITFGTNNTFFITRAGHCYAFGWNRYGQLGTKGGWYLIAQPELIDLPDEQGNFARISCGEQHTIILTRNGKAYACGDTTHGQLGVIPMRNSMEYTPQLIDTDQQGNIAQVACGHNFTGFITNDGCVYMFGDGRDGTLGDGIEWGHTVLRPQKIDTDQQGQYIQLACGKYHSMLLTRDGKAYAFGYGENGRLGDGDISRHHIAKPLLIQTDQQGSITQIACNDTQSTFITNNGNVYIFGFIDHEFISISIPQLERIKNDQPISQMVSGKKTFLYLAQDRQTLHFSPTLNSPIKAHTRSVMQMAICNDEDIFYLVEKPFFS